MSVHRMAATGSHLGEIRLESLTLKSVSLLPVNEEPEGYV